jgi:hypothetical protein
MDVGPVSIVICKDPKVLNYSLKMTIHTCISSRYFISLTKTTMFDSVKPMINSQSSNCFQRHLITTSEKERKAILMSSFRSRLSQAQGDRMTYKRFTERTYTLSSLTCNDPKVLNYSLMMTIHTCISSCGHTNTFRTPSLHVVILNHQHWWRSHNRLTRYVISLTNTTMFDCVKLMNNSAMFKQHISL